MTLPASLHCPCCGRATGQHFMYTKNACRILRCESCGLGRAEAPAFDPKSYYTGSYFSGGHADGYADYTGSEAILRAEFRRTIDVIKRFGVAGGKLLEIGCAYGFLLLEAQRDYSVYGIEISDEAVAYCRSRGLDNVFAGVITEALLERIGPVDAVVLLDVIEHLEAPDRAIEQLAHCLRPGGVLLFTTGDWGSPVARLMGASWRLMTPPQHLWYFTQSSVVALAGRLGLEAGSA